MLCAGVTVYKGLKETEVKPGEWVLVSGIGGLGHMAVQYAKAIGMHVAAADIFPDKIALAEKLGADLVVDARAGDAVEEVQKRTGGVPGALVTAVSPKAMEQAYRMLRSKGTMALVGLPPSQICLPVFDTVLKRIMVRNSIVGTRQDLEKPWNLPARARSGPSSPGTRSKTSTPSSSAWKKARSTAASFST